MKQIFILRHAKSDWEADFSHDHDRPLAPRGIKAAKAMGAWLTRTGQVPDYLVASTAVRARTTMALAAKAGNWLPEPVLTERLYEAYTTEYLAVISETPDSAGSMLLAGHEPTCSESVRLLTNGGRFRFPTGAIARVDVDVAHWRDVRMGMGNLVWFMPPRILMAGEED